MRVRRITLHPVSTRRETGAINQHVVVRLETDGGSVGVGEMSDLSHLPAVQPDLRDLEPVANDLLAGRALTQLTENVQLLEQVFPGTGKVSVIRCGLEMALYDALARYYGEPVCNLLGGKVRDRIRVCYPIFRMRSLAEVSANLARVEQRVREGFDQFRLYCGGNVDADEQFLGTLRDRYGHQVQIKSLDLSGLTDWKSALVILERLLPLADPIHVESVCFRDDLDGMAEIRRRLTKPVSEHVGGLADALRLVQARAVDIFNVALVAVGGLTAARKIYSLAEAAGMGCLVGTTQELSIGTAAQLHLACAMPNLSHPGDCTGPVLYCDDVVKGRVRYEQGHALVPGGPGWGVELDEGKLAALAAPLTMQQAVER